MKWYLIGGALLLTSSLVIGWVTAPSLDDAVPFDVPAQGRPPVLTHPGGTIADAARRFAALGLRTPTVAAPVTQPPETPAPLAAREPTPPAPPAPPPVDIAELFTRDLTAVAASTDGPVLWIVDADAPSGRRKIRTGFPYRDRWVVRAIEEQHVLLRRGKETRRVPIFGNTSSIALADSGSAEPGAINAGGAVLGTANPNVVAPREPSPSVAESQLDPAERASEQRAEKRRRFMPRPGRS